MRKLCFFIGSPGRPGAVTTYFAGFARELATRLEFLGSGPLLDHLHTVAAGNGLSSRCTFAGAVSRDHVLARMSRAKVPVVPSLNEALGLTNIESLPVATPVIASAVDGIPDLIRNGLDGFLVAPSDPADLAINLTLLLRDGFLRERLGWNARQHFLDQFEESRALKLQADCVEELFSSKTEHLHRAS